VALTCASPHILHGVDGKNFVVFFLLGDYLASEFYMPTFRNTLSVPLLIGGVSRKNNWDETAISSQ
jgi:hypothetical protein